MKVERTIPPAANPVYALQFLSALGAMIKDGKAIERFRDEFAGYLGVKNVYLLNSGKAAFALILEAFKKLLPGRTEVVVPAYTCFSVPSVIVRAGLKVVPCEIDPDTLDFEPQSLARTVNDRTLCVVPTHMFGMPADTSRAVEAASRYGAFVVEDAAQSLGVRADGRILGTTGDAAFFSFGRGKNITCGTGGMVATGSGKLASVLDDLFNSVEATETKEAFVELMKLAAMKFFLRPSLYWFPLGIPSLRLGETIFYRDFPVKRLPASAAAFMQGWIERLEASNRVRLINSKFFIKRLGLRLRTDVPYLRLPLRMKDQRSRDGFYRRTRHLGVSLMYPSPVNRISEIASLFDGRVFEAADSVVRDFVFLPTHALMKKRDMERICSIYESFTDETLEVLADIKTPETDAAHNYN